MRKGPVFVLLAAATVVGSAASCQCSGEKGGPAGSGAPAGSGTATATAEVGLAERSLKLKNGLEVELVEGACGESAALVVLLKVGIDHDPAERSGMARVAGRALSGMAAAGRAERQVETGSDYTVYSVVAAGDRLLEELDDVAGWMSKVGPGEGDLEKARAQVLEEVRKVAGGDAAWMAASFAEEAVAPTAGGGKRRGVAAEVEKITLAELQAFWEAGFRAGNAKMVVAGRFDAEKVRAHVEKGFAELGAGSAPVAREATGSSVRGTLVMGSAPTAVAVAVPAPRMDDPLFAPFLVLAARVMDPALRGSGWEADYDPIGRPEVLFVTGAVGQGEQPEPAAGRIRGEVSALLGRAPAEDDKARARERFRLLVEPRLVDPELCAKDARAFGVARARRAQLGVDGEALAKALDGVTGEQLGEAAKLFDVKRTAGVIAGGTMP